MLEWFADVGLVEQIMQTCKFSQYFVSSQPANAALCERAKVMVVQRTDILPSEPFVAKSFDNEERRRPDGCARWLRPKGFAGFT
jgi:hypothetical protein